MKRGRDRKCAVLRVPEAARYWYLLTLLTYLMMVLQEMVWSLGVSYS